MTKNLEDTLLLWSIETMLALEVRRAANAGGIPLATLREGLALTTMVEGYALPDDALDAAVGIVSGTLVESGYVVLHDGVLNLKDTVSPENLN